jgi:hypothetical protein
MSDTTIQRVNDPERPANLRRPHLTIAHAKHFAHLEAATP